MSEKTVLLKFRQLKKYHASRYFDSDHTSGVLTGIRACEEIVKAVSKPAHDFHGKLRVTAIKFERGRLYRSIQSALTSLSSGNKPRAARVLKEAITLVMLISSLGFGYGIPCNSAADCPINSSAGECGVTYSGFCVVGQCAVTCLNWNATPGASCSGGTCDGSCYCDASIPPPPIPPPPLSPPSIGDCNTIGCPSLAPICCPGGSCANTPAMCDGGTSLGGVNCCSTTAGGCGNNGCELWQEATIVTCREENFDSSGNAIGCNPNNTTINVACVANLACGAPPALPPPAVIPPPVGPVPIPPPSGPPSTMACGGPVLCGVVSAYELPSVKLKGVVMEITDDMGVIRGATKTDAQGRFIFDDPPASGIIRAIPDRKEFQQPAMYRFHTGDRADFKMGHVTSRLNVRTPSVGTFAIVTQAPVVGDSPPGWGVGNMVYSASSVSEYSLMAKLDVIAAPELYLTCWSQNQTTRAYERGPSVRLSSTPFAPQSSREVSCP